MMPKPTHTLPFKGFAVEKGPSVPLPEAFFAELLTQIDSLAELQLTLFCIYALEQRKQAYPYLTLEDFSNSPLLAAMPTVDDTQTRDAVIRQALSAALQRGTLLQAVIGELSLFFLNSVAGRAALDAIAQGRYQLNAPALPEILPPRPNIFALYEASIGALTPMISEDLKETAATYPQAWIEEAFAIAVRNNVRKLSYISAILARWRNEGRTSDEIHEKHAGRHEQQRLFGGADAAFIES